MTKHYHKSPFKAEELHGAKIELDWSCEETKFKGIALISSEANEENLICVQLTFKDGDTEPVVKQTILSLTEEQALMIQRIPEPQETEDKPRFRLVCIR